VRAVTRLPSAQPGIQVSANLWLHLYVPAKER